MGTWSEPFRHTSPLASGLTPEQNRIFQRIAWDAARNYRWSGVTKGKASP